MTSPTVLPWPAARDPLFPPLPGGEFLSPGRPTDVAENRSPAEAAPLSGMLESWRISQNTLRELRLRLEAAELPPQVLSVAVCGSLGRMEQRTDSDCDLIVLASQPLTDDDEAAVRQVLAAAVSGLFSRGSTADGIFSRPVSTTDLLDPERRGRVAEDLLTFGTRMQMLIDSQPVFHTAGFAATQRQVLQWYCEDEAATGFFPPWHYLLNDLLRYHRSLAVRYQWGWRDDLPRWRLLKVKEAHSRLLNVAGLLLLLGGFSAVVQNSATTGGPGADALGWLAHHLRLTPLERVTAVLAESSTSRADRVLAAAARLADWLADPAWVQELTSGSRPELAASPLLHSARTLGRQIRTEVAGFLREQHGNWPDELLDAVML